MDAIEYPMNPKDRWFYWLWDVIHRQGSNWYWFYWLRYCDLILSPAVDEALGRNIVESMLSKIPVIASNSGGNSEIIKNGSTGWLFEKDNYIDLAKKSIYVLNC